MPVPSAAGLRGLGARPACRQRTLVPGHARGDRGAGAGCDEAPRKLGCVVRVWPCSARWPCSAGSSGPGAGAPNQGPGVREPADAYQLQNRARLAECGCRPPAPSAWTRQCSHRISASALPQPTRRGRGRARSSCATRASTRCWAASRPRASCWRATRAPARRCWVRSRAVLGPRAPAPHCRQGCMLRATLGEGRRGCLLRRGLVRLGLRMHSRALSRQFWGTRVLSGLRAREPRCVADALVM